MSREDSSHPTIQSPRGTKPRVYAYKDLSKIVLVIYRDGARHFADYLSKEEAEDLVKDIKTALRHPQFTQKEINELLGV